MDEQRVQLAATKSEREPAQESDALATNGDARMRAWPAYLSGIDFFPPARCSLASSPPPSLASYPSLSFRSLSLSPQKWHRRTSLTVLSASTSEPPTREYFRRREDAEMLTGHPVAWVSGKTTGSKSLPTIVRTGLRALKT